MQIEEQADGILITTTDIHLRRIGEALHRAYQGEARLSLHRGGQHLRCALDAKDIVSMPQHLPLPGSPDA